MPAGVIHAHPSARDDGAMSDREAPVFQPKAGFARRDFSVLPPVYLQELRKARGAVQVVRAAAARIF